MYQIKLPDSIRYVDSLEDFYNLIDEYMGYWARKYLENKIGQREEKLNIELTDFEEEFSSYEASLSDAQNALVNIKDLVEEIQKASKAKKINSLCEEIIRIIDNQV